MRATFCASLALLVFAQAAHADKVKTLETGKHSATLEKFTAATPRPIDYYQSRCTDKSYLPQEDPFICKVEGLAPINLPASSKQPLYYSIQELSYTGPGPSFKETILFAEKDGKLTPLWLLQYEDLDDGARFMEVPSVEGKHVVLRYKDVPAGKSDSYVFIYDTKTSSWNYHPTPAQ